MMSENSTNGNVITVNDLRTYFETEDGTVKAVDGISFAVKQGETLGIVGESGSGKSVANLSLMRLIPNPPGKIVSGSVLFHGRDILKLSAREIRELVERAGGVLRSMIPHKESMEDYFLRVTQNNPENDGKKKLPEAGPELGAA